MNTQLMRHERSDLSLGFGKQEPANTALEPTAASDSRSIRMCVPLRLSATR